MKINVGSKNPQKVAAVQEAFDEYPQFQGAEIESLDISSEVSNQPKTMEETIRGAMNRARNAFINCDYSVGLESGLMEVPYTKSGHMDITACAIYDGKSFHLGGGPIFEYPKHMVDLILKDGLEVDEAAHQTAFTDNPRAGKAQGIIGILTKEKITRKSQAKEAVITALIHLLNPEHY